MSWIAEWIGTIRKAAAVGCRIECRIYHKSTILWQFRSRADISSGIKFTCCKVRLDQTLSALNKVFFSYAELSAKYKNQAILALDAQPTILFAFAARKLSDMRPDDPEAASSPVHGFKRDLIRLIGNLSHGNKENQDLVRIISIIDSSTSATCRTR